ncbi:FAD-dependent oxidoreductase [Streptomyces mobaraensis]|uniref:FAD-dependent oxidoreductase n=1 Tax=Streptomyces mobaraensis TaxID=35621 RepID=UPI0033C9444C
MTSAEPELKAASAARPVHEETCDAVVIGAGMAGLTAATTLADESDVIVLEAADRAGGRVETVRKGDYWINVGTQFTEGTGPLIDALHHHGIEMGSLAGKSVALALNGRLVDTSDLFALMFRTRMSLTDRVGMAMVGARILAAVPFLTSESRIAKRVRARLDRRVASRILPELPQRYRNAFDDIRYGRYVIVGFFTAEEGPQPWDDLFGVSTPRLSFQAVFNHAAAIRKGGARKPGGALACFAGGAVADDLFELSDEEIVDRFVADLMSVYPQLRGKLGEGIVRRHRRVVPFWAPGRRASLPTLREPLGPIHLAGDYQLDMPSLADAATSGENAAKAVLASLGS